MDLPAFLLWLWPLTCLPERYCRQMCMWLMDKLALLQMQDAMQTGPCIHESLCLVQLTALCCNGQPHSLA